MPEVGIDLREWQRQHERDRRLKMVADSVSAEVMNIACQPDPDDWRKGVHDIVKLTAVTVIKRLYDDDAELRALRAERDHYRKVAERALLTAPPRLMVQSDRP